MNTMDFSAPGAHLNYGDQEAPEQLLAALLFKDLDLAVAPARLREFVRTRFDRLSVLAHRIHRGAP